uniref:Uncharacterized protein n=1 Tax=Picea glauca TaxID=3330 RepID=A0A117NG94_PICGL|nr:hypothetical protein ABT39_MTgene1574 [Picea glauca]
MLDSMCICGREGVVFSYVCMMMLVVFSIR